VATHFARRLQDLLDLRLREILEGAAITDRDMSAGTFSVAGPRLAGRVRSND
jgi:hypothetical protein